jgi:hypothetical protein
MEPLWFELDNLLQLSATKAPEKIGARCQMTSVKKDSAAAILGMWC